MRYPARQTMPAALYLGGELELKVPILVTFRAEPYVPATYMDPPEGGYAELLDARRTDGLQWHDGCQQALAAWWDGPGQAEAMERANDHATPEWEAA